MNVFKQLWRSLFSPKDISRFRFQGIGKTILYIFILAVIASLPSAVQFVQTANTIFKEGQVLIENDLPSFDIVDSELVVNGESPAMVRGEGLTLIVDDTGSTNPDSFRTNTTTIAFLETEFVVSLPDGVFAYPYDSFQGIPLSSDEMVSYLSSLDSGKVVFIPLVLTAIYLFSAAWLFIKITIYAFVGVLFARSFLKKLTYRHAFRIAAYSVTLSTVFFSIMGIIGSSIPAPTLIDWFVTMVILFMAIKEIPTPKKKATA